MSTDNNNDRWRAGNTIEGEHEYRNVPAGVFLKDGTTGWIAMLGNNRWRDFVGNEPTNEDDCLRLKRTIIARPPDAPASIPHYQPHAKPADMNAGRKDDSGKNRLDLLPPHALCEIGKVLTFGAARYGDDNWRKVTDARKRYTAALLRHVVAWMCGERNDAESGLHHLAHAGACVMFLLDVECKAVKP